MSAFLITKWDSLHMVRTLAKIKFDKLHLRIWLDTLRSYTDHLEAYASTVEEIWMILCGPKKEIVRDTPLVYFRMTILDKKISRAG